jgi:adenosylcobalamin-dependent ribonucleoside-triphosphate reductase
MSNKYIKLLSNEFLAKYPDFPEHFHELGTFVYYRTYSRFIPAKGRRETWKETCTRSITYNVGLAIQHLERLNRPYSVEDMQQEAEDWFDAMFNTEQFLSGRTLWVGGASSPNGKSVAELYPLANFNCSFLTIKDWKSLAEQFYLLLVGTGTGFKATKKMAASLPPIRNNVNIIHSDYKPLSKPLRLERTKLTKLDNGFAKILVGDSKEGWVESLAIYLDLLSNPEHEGIHTIKISYNSVRPKAERLETFGGHASGYEPLKDMFEGFMQVLRNEIDPTLTPPEVVDAERGYVKVRPIHILDMGNLIGNNVVVGGVRRTAEIFLFDADDYESMFAKYGLNGIWGDESFERHEKIRQLLTENGVPVPVFFDTLAEKTWGLADDQDALDWALPNFPTREEAEAYIQENGIDGIRKPFPYNFGRPYHHRRMSNNSVAFTSKPTKKQLDLIFEMLQFEGEPGFVNLEELARRRLLGQGITNPSRELLEDVMELIGMNPCAEIDLYDRGVCNLTTVNFMMFIEQDVNGRYFINMKRLLEAQRRSTRAGLRMTLANLEHMDWAEDSEAWDRTQKTDRLIGTSVTGLKDAMAVCGYDESAEKHILTMMSDVTAEENEKYARLLRIPAALLDTTVKPEGTLSQVATSKVLRSPVSSGLHWSHAPYFIRRVRISAVDPLAKAVQELGWTVHAEVGTLGFTNPEDLAKPEAIENAQTIVVDFPIESGAKETKDDVSALQQLDTYFRFQEVYTRHNSSNTITVKPDEWGQVEDVIFEKWDEFCAVSFLAHSGGTYVLAPYQSITEEEFRTLKASMKPFDSEVLRKVEGGVEQEIELAQDGCENGVCPIR